MRRNSLTAFCVIILLMIIITGCKGSGSEIIPTESPEITATLEPTQRPTVDSFLNVPQINGSNANGLEEIGIIEEHATRLTFSPDGKLLAVGTWDKGVNIYDVVKMQLVQNLPNMAYVSGLTFAPDGRFLIASVNTRISADETNTVVYVWRTADWSMVADVDINVGADSDTELNSIDLFDGFLNYAPNGSIILSSGHNTRLKTSKIYILRVEGNTLITTLEIDPPTNSSVWGSVLMPDGLSFLSGDTVYDLTTGEPIIQIQFENDRTTTAAISPDGRLLAYASLGSRQLQVAALPDLTRSLNLMGLSEKALSIDFSSDGALVAATAQDHTLHIWRVYDGVELATLEGTYGVDFSPMGNLLAVIHGDVNNVKDSDWSVKLYGILDPGAVTPIPTAVPTATPIAPTSTATPSTPLPPTATATFIYPTVDQSKITPTPYSYSYWEPCPGTYSSRLQLGGMAYVSPGLGSNRVREHPEMSSTVVGSLPEFAEMVIIDGPRCADGWIWWKVQSDVAATGWTSEGQPGQYWLVPK